MIRILFLALLLASPATADVLDLSKPQTGGFKSIVDLRGNADLRPQDGSPQIKEDPINAGAIIPVNAIAGPTYSQPKPVSTQSQRTVHVSAYVRKDGVAVRSHTRSPSGTLRMGRRR